MHPHFDISVTNDFTESRRQRFPLESSSSHFFSRHLRSLLSPIPFRRINRPAPHYASRPAHSKSSCWAHSRQLRWRHNHQRSDFQYSLVFPSRSPRIRYLFWPSPSNSLCCSINSWDRNWLCYHLHEEAEVAASLWSYSHIGGHSGIERDE
jgi:hypothetical protein